MIFERWGRRYEVILGNDLDRDSMFLEMRDVSEDLAGTVVLFGEKTAEGEFRVLVGPWEALQDPPGGSDPPFLPLILVEEFLSLMKSRL